jgi:hypothetical protein
MTARNRGINRQTVDRLLADRAYQPSYEPPPTLRARTVERVRDDMRRHSSGATAPAAQGGPHWLWRLAGGALGVGVVAGAWLFALQVWGVRQPAGSTDGVVAQATPLAVVASIDDRLFEQTRGAATRLATAVNMSYRREIDAMEIDARNAAVRAAEYATWLRKPAAPVKPDTDS